MTSKQETTLVKLIDANELTQKEVMDKFNAIINIDPPKSWREKHPVAKDVEYVPIGRVETLLKQIFQEWYVETLREGPLFNSVYCAIRLFYKHPVTGEWLHQDGYGAVPVKTDKDHTAADLAHIKNDAIQTGLPAAESEAIKDAAHKIGKIFGGDLNRKHTMDFNGQYTLSEDDKIEAKFKAAKTAEQVDAIMSHMPAEDQKLYAVAAKKRCQEIRNGGH